MLKWLYALLVAVGLASSSSAHAYPQNEPLGYQKSPDCRYPGATPDWTWLEVDRPRREQLEAGWLLLIDHTRFAELRLTIELNAGDPVVVAHDTSLPSRRPSLGNKLAYEMPLASGSISRICLGYVGLDDLSLMRTIKAMSPDAHDAHLRSWLFLIAAVSGVLFCALVYNLFLMTCFRSSFQRWYVIWLASGLAYTVCWSGAVYYLMPALDGSWRIRANLVLVSTLIGSATAFFFDFIESEKIPNWLRRIGLYCAGLVPILGVIATFDQMLPAKLTDALLNLSFLATILLVSLGIAVGIGRGSRAVWFYLAAWTAPMIVFMLRVGRNFGLLPQSDLVDMASFLALAFEAMVLSLAVADRFRQLHRDRDAADAERVTLRRVAHTDALTGLANRAAFQARLGALHPQASADLLIIDLDDLKDTNDTAGHDAGDALIVEAGQRLLEWAGHGGLVARLGGDEFAVLLVDGERERLPVLLEGLEQSGNRRFNHNGHSIEVRFSAGLSTWSADDGTPERIYKEADLALYRAKAEGRGSWCAYNTGMYDEQNARRTLIAQARSSLQRDEFELHFQPVVDLRTNEIVSHEALLRWRHPSGDLLAPGKFMQIFDDRGLSQAMQERVLSIALDTLVAKDTREQLGVLSVNFLACQLQGKAAADEIVAALASRHLPPARLIVEVTESVILGRPGGAVMECLRELRKQGVGLALDDFGTGYASLVHLRELPADALKIDQSFVASLERNEESTKIVRAIISLAHNLGIRVVAEGIESEGQRQCLRRLGCDQGQGHLFGFPKPLTCVLEKARIDAA